MSQADGSIIIDTKIDQTGLSKGLGDMQGAVVKGVAAITAAIGAASVAVIALGSEFEQANAKASTLFGDAQVDMTQYQGKMLELSNKTGLAATELGNTMYDALSAGIPASDDMSEAMGFLEKNTKLAKAGFTDINTATTATAKVLNAYKMDVSETDRVHKVLMQTQNKGITTVNELGSVLSQVTPTASAMGVSFEQVGAALAGMTAQGTPTAQATTQLNQLIAELGKNGTQANKSMTKMYEDMGYGKKSFKELMDEGVTLVDIIVDMEGYAKDNDKSLIDMFGSLEAGKAALSMAGDNAITFTNNLEAMKTQTDVVGEAYDKVTDTFKEKSAKVVNSLKNVGIAAYSKFEKPLKKSMDVAQKSVDSLSREMSNGKLGKSVDTIAKGFGKLIEVAADLASKAIPLVVNGFSLLIDNGKELTIAFTAIGGAMLYYKNQAALTALADKAILAGKTALTVATIAYEAAQVALTNGLGMASAAQAALNAVMSLSPIGMTTIAIGALVGGITALVFAMSDEDNAHKKNMEAINAEIEARDELKQKQSEQLSTNLGEITNIQSLNNELKNLVDANGKVKKGYEARTAFIVNELNEALGLNMRLTDGEIKGYDKLSSSIDDLIAKKRAEVILESQLPAYKEAVTKATNAQIEANKLNTQITENHTKSMQLEAELLAKYGENWKMSYEALASAQGQAWANLEADTVKKQTEYSKQNELINGYYNDISTYETNAALIASENADNYSKVQASSLIAKQDTTKGKIEASQQEIQAEKSYIEYLKGEYRNETDNARKEQLEAQIKAKEATIKTEQEKLDGMKSTIVNKGPEYDAEVKRLAQNALNSFNGDTQKYFGVSKDKFQKVIDGIDNKDPDVRKKAQKTAEGILKNLQSKNDEYSKQGAYVLDGVINGVNSKSGDVFATMRNFGSNMLTSFKNALEIKSPSRKFAKVAKFIPDGISKGIKDNKGVVSDSIEDLSNEMMSSFSNINLSNDFDAIKSAIYAEQAKMGLIVDAQAKTEILKTSLSKIDLSSMTATVKAVIDNHVYIGDRETAHVLAPLISEEMAFQGR